MKKKSKIIQEIFEKYNNNDYSTIIIFTKKFKIVGKYVTTKASSDLISLENPQISTYSTNCECSINEKTKELKWINIFSQEVIAFSFCEDY